jgi:uncharacterized protein with FMN-binding domain
MKKMLYFMLAAILICGCKQEAPLTFQAGTYEVTAQGHNGDIRLSVTFSDSCITDIKVLEQHETPHIGDIVFDELIPQIIKANGTGVDAMTGATVTSRALMKGVAEAANMAKVSDGKQFKKACQAQRQDGCGLRRQDLREGEVGPRLYQGPRDHPRMGRESV